MGYNISKPIVNSSTLLPNLTCLVIVSVSSLSPPLFLISAIQRFYGVMTTHYHSFNSVIYTYFHEGFILPLPSVSALIKPLHRSFHGTKIDDLKSYHVYESQITTRGT